jgi:glycosyltransferase involved in cell wall biosynthesis
MQYQTMPPADPGDMLHAGTLETFREGEPPCEPSANAAFREGEPPCEPSANAGSDGASPSQARTPGSHREKYKVPVSVIIPVKNEAANLARCLPALAWADQVFVVDSQSSDQTAELAASFGAEVVQFHFNGNYPKKKNWALDNLPFRNEWVMIVDADEVVVAELANEIADRIGDDLADGYYLNSRYYFLGRHIRHCGYSSCWNLRLFKHRLGRYEKIPDGTGGRAGDNEAHEHVELDGRVLRLSHELEHHAYPTVAVWVEKHNRYAIWEAALADRVINEPIPKTIGGVQRFKRRLKKIAWRLPLRPLVRFVYAYVLRLGFLDGKPGLYFCSLLAFYDFLALANRYEMRIASRSS